MHSIVYKLYDVSKAGFSQITNKKNKEYAKQTKLNNAIINK